MFSVPGGDTVQLIKTAERLRKMGISVDISTDLDPPLAGYDLVHLFNLTRPQEVYLQARNAKRQGRKIALSTIYVLYSEFERKARRGLTGFVGRNIPPWQVERLKVIARAIANGEFGLGSLLVAGVGYKSLCNRVIAFSDVLLPNSTSEARRVHADFPTSRSKNFVVVPNAVDTLVFDPERVTLPEAMRRLEGCILSVARIEGLKCQLELVRATRDLDVDVVLIGKSAPNHASYYEAIKREASNRVHLIGQISHEELPHYYAAAKVHALISWMETTGLSSLEAGAMGCNLVVTEKGDTRDYFRDDAEYCDPGSVESIRNAVVRALEAPKSSSLRDRIRSDYTWEKAAQMTAEGYRLAFES